jgi:hypothetical protein
MLEKKDWFYNSPQSTIRLRRPFQLEYGETVITAAIRYGYVELDEIDGSMLMEIEREELHYPYMLVTQWKNRQTVMFFSDPSQAFNMWSQIKNIKITDKLNGITTSKIKQSSSSKKQFKFAKIPPVEDNL